ncbi:germination protein YpeB [Kyrpidia spormannii]|uniref:Spore germination membrane component n=1 Tax=Kyrpidia spormannii TaxID=2055160 RepID=A0ACA8Z8X6_9BACL|nr:germination protein YpeB [Kyrpidia spormannii]CAB3391970.1 spore germination membrane component [Kyrpidia spormannii]
MYTRVAAVLTPILAVALVVTGFWGYREHRQKQAVLLKAENQYQRAFHDLTTHVDQLQDELGKAMAINSVRQQTPCMTNIWRLAFAAQSDVGQLPLTLMPFHKTQEFLNNIGQFSYRLGVKDPQKPLGAEDWATLKNLYGQAAQVETDLRQVQSNVLSHNLRWMDAETAISDTQKKGDNQIIDGFQKLEKQVTEFPEVSFGPTNRTLESRIQEQPMQALGPAASPQQVAAKVKQFLGLAGKETVKVQENGKGNPTPSYSVTVQDGQASHMFLDVTKQGGHVLWYMNDRAVNGEKVDLSTGAAGAASWLRAHGYPVMEMIQADQTDNVGVYEFIPVERGVRLYPDKVTVKVALDNGEVIGLSAKDYVYHHRPRNLPVPTLSLAQAQQRLSPHVTVHEHHLALIPNDEKQEVLAYEFLGTIDRDTYRIYINAQNGDEEGVEKMRREPSGTAQSW